MTVNVIILFGDLSQLWTALLSSPSTAVWQHIIVVIIVIILLKDNIVPIDGQFAIG